MEIFIWSLILIFKKLKKKRIFFSLAQLSETLKPLLLQPTESNPRVEFVKTLDTY